MSDSENVMENRIDEHAIEVFKAMGFSGRLPDEMVEKYRNVKYFNDRIRPARLSPEMFALIASDFLPSRVDEVAGPFGAEEQIELVVEETETEVDAEISEESEVAKTPAVSSFPRMEDYGEKPESKVCVLTPENADKNIRIMFAGSPHVAKLLDTLDNGRIVVAIDGDTIGRRELPGSVIIKDN